MSGGSSGGLMDVWMDALGGFKCMNNVVNM